MSEYVSIWKDECFWQRIIKFLSIFCACLLVILTSLDLPYLRLWVFIVLSLDLFIIMINDTVFGKFFNEKTDRKKTALYRTLLFLIITSIFFTGFYTIKNNEKFFELFFISLIVLFIIFGIVFKEKIRNIGVFRYVFNDYPPLFSKRFFRERFTGEIVGAFITGVIFLALTAFFVYRLVIQWN